MKLGTKASGLVIMMLFMVTIASNGQRKAKRKADDDTQMWRYELECEAIGKPGSKVVKVWSYSKKPQIAIEQAKKNAVHGIIFKGYAGSKDGCTPQKPLARNSNVEMEKAEYFKTFFSEGGRYLKFVSVTGEGSITKQDVIKVDKEYKIGVIVVIQSDMLRKDLESAGVIKSLSTGF
nr:hypothetical protein [uncultured Carboxylicivirga sp.]